MSVFRSNRGTCVWSFVGELRHRDTHADFRYREEVARFLLTQGVAGRSDGTKKQSPNAVVQIGDCRIRVTRTLCDLAELSEDP